MRIRNIAFTAAVFIILSLIVGCATVGVATFAHEDPTPVEAENEVFVPIPFEQAWDRLVMKLATQFYVINNIDKASRLINVSFSGDRPELFVTGGTTTREFRRNDNVERFTYDPAASSRYKTGWKWGEYKNLPATGTFYRETSLEGRANIYVAPDANGTRLTVNCRYVLTVKVTGTYVAEDAFGTPVESGAIPSSSATASFNTNAPAKVNWGTPAEPSWATFRSTGKFEKDILALLRDKGRRDKGVMP